MENQDSELRTLDFYKCLVFCHIKHYFPTHTEPTQLFCCEHTYCTFRPGLWSSWLSDLKCGSIRAITLSLTLFYFTCITGIPLLHVFKFPCIFKASLNVSPPPLHHTLLCLSSFPFFLLIFSPTHVPSPLLQKLWRKPFQTQTLSSHYLFMLSTLPPRRQTLAVCPQGHLAMKFWVGEFCCIFFHSRFNLIRHLL